MLSRVADSLFWLSRYIERAENLARLIEVSDHDSLDASSGSDSWAAVLYATGTADAYEVTTAKVKEKKTSVSHFIAFSEGNNDSIRKCIAHARENARMVRDQISAEMWLELNRFHLFVNSSEAEDLWRSRPEEFYSRVIQFSLLHEGLIASTILHDEGWQFIQAGKFIERADKTSRILDMLNYGNSKPTRIQLASVLRSCSGLTAFRAEFRGEITRDNVVAFLLFSQSFPRSMRYAVRGLDQTLHALSGSPVGSFANEVERLTGSLLSQLNYTSLESVWQTSLHTYIDQFQTSLNDIGQSLFETYVLLPSEYQNLAWLNSTATQWQQQQQ